METPINYRLPSNRASDDDDDDDDEDDCALSLVASYDFTGKHSSWV